MAKGSAASKFRKLVLSPAAAALASVLAFGCASGDGGGSSQREHEQGAVATIEGALCLPAVEKDPLDPECDPGDMTGGPEGCGVYTAFSCDPDPTEYCHTYCWRQGQCARGDCVWFSGNTGCCVVP